MNNDLLRTILRLPITAISFAARSIGVPPTPLRRLRCGSVRTIEKFLSAAGRKAPRLEGGSTRALDLGCGGNPRNPFGAGIFSGIDIRENHQLSVRGVDLFREPIPFADCSFDFVTAFDFIEHVPRVGGDGATRFPFVELMDEIHRVLKVGGFFFAKTPAYPFPEAFQDPTHVNVITEETFSLYFCVGGCHPLARAYGFKGSFELVSQKWWGGSWLLTLLQKI